MWMACVHCHRTPGNGNFGREAATWPEPYMTRMPPTIPSVPPSDLLVDLTPEPHNIARWEGSRAPGVLLTLLQRWKLIASIAFVGVCLGILYIVVTVPKYTSSILVELDARQTKYVDFDNVVGDAKDQQIQVRVRSETDVIQSESMGARIVDVLDLVHDPEFNHTRGDSLQRALLYLKEGAYGIIGKTYLDGARRPEDVQRAIVIRNVMRGLRLTTDVRSLVIKIEFTANSVAKAMRIVRAFADMYLQSQIDEKMRITLHASEWIKRQLEDARHNVESTNQEIAKYRQEHGLGAVGEDIRGSKEQLNAMLIQLGQASTASAEAQARLQVAQDLVKRGRTDQMPEVWSSEKIRSLHNRETELRQRLTEMEKRYGPYHPAMRAVKAKAIDIRERIQGELTRHMASIRSAANAARAQEDTLQREIGRLRSAASTADTARIHLAYLERNAEIGRAFFNTLASRYAETAALEHGQYPDARIVGDPVAPNGPSSPNVILVLSAWPLGAGMFAILLALWLDHNDESFRTTRHLEDTTGVACLGLIPELTVDSPVFIEAVRTIRAAIAVLEHDNGNPSKTILVTSAVPQEGKSVSSVAIARALAEGGHRTLLIDADLRRVRRFEITAGRPFCNARATEEIFTAREMAEFIQRARLEYDTIVIDSPPSLVVADASALVPYVDTVLLVVRWGETRRTAVWASIERLRRFRCTRMYTVLTRVDAKRYATYDHGGGNQLNPAYSGYISGPARK